MAAAVVEMLAGGDVEVVPIAVEHVVGAVVVVVPGGEDELGVCMVKGFE